MITSITSIRVRYNEVDRMGYLHHGNYAAYFEIGRTELMREYGITYKNMEEQGILLPLSEFYIKYIQPAFYDEVLNLETTLATFSGVRLIFKYKLKNQNNQLIAEGETPLVFVSSETGKPMRPPAGMVNKITPYFK